MGMKANGGFFHGTLGSTYVNGSNSSEKYSERNISLPDHIKDWMNSLKKKGDTIQSVASDFSMKDVSVLSKETGVEYAKVVIGDKSYLIRGDESGTSIPKDIIRQLRNNNGVLEFHTHPFNDDLVASISDRNLMKAISRITGQKTSKIVTPNGRVSEFGADGVVEISSVSNSISEDYAESLRLLFGGNENDKY